MKEGATVTATLEQRVDFLGRVRDARALILRDAESFHFAVCVLEHIGQAIAHNFGKGRRQTLGYHHCI